VSIKYDIRFILGNFIGSWTIGAGTTWEEGCDYTNAKHRENIIKSVTAMVNDNKDEPYVLLWLLGNENNIATWSNCNASKHYEEYLRFVNDLAKIVHKLDPNHPIALCEGYKPADLMKYKALIPDVDIIGYNSYMGQWGFGNLWKLTSAELDKPVFISEYGICSYDKVKGNNEKLQLAYHEGCWKDIDNNASGKTGAGNSIGGCIFDYLDRWYMDGKPEMQNGGTKYCPYTQDHVWNEEYFGITSMGDGKDNIFKRQLKEVYYFYKENWNK